MRFTLLPDLNLLCALDMLLREQSVSRAAQRMSISQSAMSHSLARLREALGDPLLVREGRTMKLTPLAEQLQKPLQNTLISLDHLLRDVGLFDPATSTTKKAPESAWRQRLPCSSIPPRSSPAGESTWPWLRCFRQTRRFDASCFLGCLGACLRGVDTRSSRRK